MRTFICHGGIWLPIWLLISPKPLVGCWFTLAINIKSPHCFFSWAKFHQMAIFPNWWNLGVFWVFKSPNFPGKKKPNFKF
jgi:hypothetical protein